MPSVGERAVYAIFYPWPSHPWLQRLVRASAFLLGSPWLVAWWGPSRLAAMWAHFVVRGHSFELDYAEVLRELGSVRGVLHVGANVGQEAALYTAMGVPKVLWVECQEECKAPLEAAVAAAGRTHDTVVIAAVADSTGATATLHRVSNSISSSLKPLGAGHRTFFPFLRQEAPQPVTTTTLDDLLITNGLKFDEYDTLYLDVQGGELDVLKGAEQALSHVRAVMTEVSCVPHYQGGVLEEELHAWLTERGFTRTQRMMPPLGHGNALYLRAKDTPRAAS